MASRKKLVANRADLANQLTKLEGGKSQIKVGDAREFLRKLKELEKLSIVSGARSVIMMIRREARNETMCLSRRGRERLRNRGVK